MSFATDMPAASPDGLHLPDAFSRTLDWLKAFTPEPEPSPLAGTAPDSPFIISQDLRAALGDEGIALLRKPFDHIIEEE